MKTEDFINKLSSNLTPVKRIYPLPFIFTVWVLFSFALVLIFVWSKSNNFELIHIPKHFYEISTIILLVLSSGFMGIYLSVPGNRISNNFKYLPICFLLFWIISLLIRFLLGDPTTPQDDSYHGCSKDIFLMSLPLASVFIYIINRRLPFQKTWIGFWILTASGSASTIGVAFLCSNENPTHLLPTHLFPVIILGLFGILLGALLFKEV